jgi:hypothetical protein
MFSIEKADENSNYLDDLLRKGWEPFAITSEKRCHQEYDDYRNRNYAVEETVSVVWLKKLIKEE